MRVSAVLLISTLVTAVVAHDADPDIGRGMVAIVQSHGYSIQRHFVTTADGYILQVFRIPTAIGESSAPSKIKPVVLLQHALLDSSWAYVANQPHQSLGYLLADAGYDVWFGNNRGNVYSTNHTSFPLDSKEFWDFSYDEMALLDLPATVDYILATTKVPTLSYIGHSEAGLLPQCSCRPPFGFSGTSPRREAVSHEPDVGGPHKSDCSRSMPLTRQWV